MGRTRWEPPGSAEIEDFRLIMMYDARVALVIAHRGASGTRPENTLASFRHAEALGAHMVELDVQLSRDGAVVVIHDWTLGRTTGARGRVASRTLAELQALDAGAWFAPGFRGERIPTLQQVLDAITLPINVELKARGEDGLEARASEVVEAAGAERRVVYSSFHPESLVRLRRRSPSAAIAVLTSEHRLAPALRLAGRVGATALHIRKDGVAPGEVHAAVTQGLQVRAWTVNDPEEFARLADAGVSGVFTDFPERFLQSGDPCIAPRPRS
jgi:glycerophosphoryl diester phosphodiesterase